MGYVFADLELSNPRRPELQPVRVEARADTGSLMLCIPPHVAQQLDLETESYRDITVADGRSARVPYVGPIKIVFENRMCFVGALVLGDETLLGAVPMEDLDVVIIPGQRSIAVNPANPNYAHSFVKTAAGPRPLV